MTCSAGSVGVTDKNRFKRIKVVNLNWNLRVSLCKRGQTTACDTNVSVDPSLYWQNAPESKHYNDK